MKLTLSDRLRAHLAKKKTDELTVDSYIARMC